MIISIHDITPRRLDAADRWRAAAQARIPGPVSLLVVPRYAGRDSWRAGPGGAWLRERERAGDEVVVHGYAHTRAGRDGAETAGRGPRWVDAVVAEGAAELRAVGVRPSGFIAPAYGGARGVAAACATAGLSWWATRFHLRAQGARYAVPSIGLGASRPARRALSPAVARGVAGVLAAWPVVRIDLHTADLEHPRLAAAGRELMDVLAGQGRRPVTHDALIRRA